MRLYYFETSNPRKACAVARHLALDVEYVRVDLDKLENRDPAYLAVNPNGKVPTLVDGDLILWESDVIMCHMARSVGSDLFPEDDRALMIMNWLFWNATQFGRYASVFYSEVAIKTRFNLGPPDAAKVDAAVRPFRRFARVLDRHLSGRDYVVGSSVTVADFALASTLPDAEAARMPLREFDEIRRWHDGLMRLPAWSDPFPARQAA